MKKFNQTHIVGLLYEHNLEERVTGENSKNPGTQYITGTISIATDDAITNIVPVHFTYVTATTNKGNINNTYTTLKAIINGTYKTVMSEGADVATKLRIDSAIGLNEFYSDRNGDVELVSVKRNEGGFIHIISAYSPVEADNEKVRNTFKVDMLITGTRNIEADEERDRPEKLIVKGAIFDFRGSILPVEFSAINPKAIAYFEGLEASQKEPVFTQVWGQQISRTVVKKYEQESAFGESYVQETTTTEKDFVITGAKPEPYEWDDESTITAAELKEAMSERETYLATLKTRYDDYKKNNQSNNVASPSTEFNF